MTSARATLYFLVATLLWGLTFVFIKTALISVSPYVFIFERFLLGTFFLALINPSIIMKIDVNLVKSAFLLSVFLFSTILFQTIGLQYVNASTASFITGTASIYVVFLVALTTRKLPNIQNVIAVALALIGLGFITLLHSSVGKTGAVYQNGWIVLCSMCFAVYIFLAKKIVRDLPIVALTFLQFLIMSAFALICVFIHHDSIYIPTATQPIISVLYCGIFASGVAFMLQLKSQQLLSPQKASILFSMEPVFATIAAVLILHEPLTREFIIGSLFIFISILIVK